MLELTRPFGAPVRSFLSPLVVPGLAREAWELDAYWRLRREIFCDELGLFAGPAHDRDSHDVRALPIVAVAHSAGTPDAVVGIVRIYATDGGVWYGGRLGVAREYRVRPHVGAGLIACAVATAAAHGSTRFLAHVLGENAAYFARHHFRPQGELELCGRRHVLMQADLSAFTTRAVPPRARRAA